MLMIDLETKQILYNLSEIFEDAVDKLAAKRDSSTDDKYLNRYITKKVQSAAINIRLAIDKFEANV